MERTENKIYPLDSSAVIHLASRREDYTNSFRISVTLTEDVRPSILQKALDHIRADFPTIIAGIRRGKFQYEVVPADSSPLVRLDREYLACMDEEMIRSCAMRVLYREKQIAVEIFHALTDGYGGLIFVRALVMEYLFLKHGVTIGKTGIKCLEERGDGEGEVRDDFLTYAGTKTASFNHRKVYCLTESCGKEGQKNIVTTGIYEVKEILDIAHSFGVSLTTFLTAVMVSSVIEMETNSRRPEEYEPIQIMVPVNLRRKFKSSSIRNFSLYALPCVRTSEFLQPFQTLVTKINGQLKQQLSREHLAGMISTNVRLQKMRIIRDIPLNIKESVLRLCFRYFGERNSCLTLSNLGEVSFPEEVQSYVERVELILSPRRNAPYNCGLASYRGKLYINFIRRSGKGELERIFFQRLANLGCEGIVQLPDGSISVESTVGKGTVFSVVLPVSHQRGE